MEPESKLSELSEGMSLPVVQRTITQEKINRYAEASGDFNPIHINEEFARKTPAGGTIAHGMLVLAYISQLMTSSFGQSWLRSGTLGVRFRAPARPGDVLTVSGKVVRVEDVEDKRQITCDVLCANQNNEVIINGEAKVRVK
jgi:3-hydroxybutyryl-CoA dehydratase